MDIHIRAMGFALTEGIRAHVESRIKSALRPFAAWVGKICTSPRTKLQPVFVARCSGSWLDRSVASEETRSGPARW